MSDVHKVNHQVSPINKVLLCWGCSLVNIHMKYKYLYTLCPFRKVYPHTSSPNLLVINFLIVEINKGQSNEKIKSYFVYLACYSKRISHHDLCFSKDSKAGRRVGKLCSRINGRLQVCPDCWHREAVAGLTRSRA